MITYMYGIKNIYLSNKRFPYFFSLKNIFYYFVVHHYNNEAQALQLKVGFEEQSKIILNN